MSTKHTSKPSIFLLRSSERLISLIFILLSFIFSCARIGSPTGGPKDEQPPKVVQSVPENYSTRFTGDKILITFDEYFELRNIRQKLVVSPPMKQRPEFKIKGKTLEIKLLDSLQPDRTYALNFGDALVDLNEANPLNNFQFVFSTGDELDSLRISGKVVHAFDGKPADEVVVMLYDRDADSLPMRELPLYIAKTDKEGSFTLLNLAAGDYKLFALKDGNNNFLFDQPTEAVAFLDTLVRPGLAFDPVAPRDSTDSLPPNGKHRFVPDKLLLRLFTEVRPNSYIAGTERPGRDQIRLLMSQGIDSIRLDFKDMDPSRLPLAPEWYGDPDTLDFWVTDTLFGNRDTLSTIVWFPAFDSLELPFMKSDTLRLTYRPPSRSTGPPKKDFVLSSPSEKSRSVEPGRHLTLTTTLPFARIDTAQISLTTGKDSLARPVTFNLMPDTLIGLNFNRISDKWIHPRQVRLNASLLPDSSYTLLARPGAFTGYRGQQSDSLKVLFSVKGPDQYATLVFKISGLDGAGVLEIIGAGSRVVASQVVEGEATVTFGMMNPGKYNARMILDTNRNGRWDTGRYLRRQQPERVLVFSKDLNLKANWEVEEPWEVDAEIK
jgi:uncharacterized protein (DUF2141 family)